MATTGALSNAGVMAANGTVSATAGTTLTNNSGSMLSGGGMTLAAGTALTNQAGLIQSGGDMALTAGTRIDNRRGPISGSTQQTESTGAATLSSGGALALTAPVVRNEASLLASAGDMSVTAGTFENVVHSLLWRTTSSWTSCSRKWYGRSKCNTYYSTSDSYTQTPSLVYAGGTFGIGAASLTNTGTLQAHKVNAVAGVMTNGIVDWTIKTMPAATPSARIDLTQYASLPAGTSGLFDLHRDAASRYVITTTVALGTLVDPDALNARLGPAAASNPRFFADPFAEAQMLARAALAQTGQRFFIPESKTDEQQRRALYDNAAAFAASRNDVKLGVAFTDAQIAALSKPVLWYVDDGTGVLAPTVYLPQVSRQNLAHLEGGRIIADEASLQVAGAFTNTGFVNVSGALVIDAGSIVNEQRLARDTALRTVKSKGLTYGQDVVLNVLQQGGEITAGSMRLSATGDIATSGGKISSAGALAMVAGGDVTLSAARVENHERVSGGKAGYTLDTVVNHAAAIAAGLDLSVVAGGDVTVAGSKLTAGGDASLRAGGDVTIAAVVDEYYYHGWSKKSRSKLDITQETTRNQGAELVAAGGDVAVVAHDNLAVQASRVAASGDVSLTAETGAVALLSGTDTSFVHEKSSRESMVWQSTRDRGESGTSVKMTELEAGGALKIAAAKGVTADYRASGDLKSSLAELAKNPATAWTAQVALRDDVTWRAVQEAHQSWDYKTQGLSGPAAAVIAIAVAVATSGAGLGAGLFGGQAVLGATGAAMVDAGMSALISQAAVSVINNRGDIGKVLKELSSAQTVKNLAVAMATAGAFNAIGTATDGHFGGSGVNEAGQTPLEYLGSANHAANVVGHALVGCASGAAGGGNCGAGALAAGLGAATGPAVAGLGTVPGVAITSAVGGIAAELGGGKFEEGASTAAAGYLFNQMMEAIRSDPGRVLGYAQSRAEMSKIDQFLRENLGVTFFAGGTAEATVGMGQAATGGFYADTKGNTGLFVSGSETTGFSAGRGGTIGFQYGLAGNNFVGSGYYSYNFSTPLVGASVLFDMNTGSFSGLSLNSPGKPGVSGGPTHTCIYGQPRTGC